MVKNMKAMGSKAQIKNLVPYDNNDGRVTLVFDQEALSASL